MLDYHIHSTFSTDGYMTMDEACLQAIEVGLKGNCYYRPHGY